MKIKYIGNSDVSLTNGKVYEVLSEAYGTYQIVEEWRKMKGIGYVDLDEESYKAELHWYEEPTVGRIKFKVKEIIDES